MFHTVLAAEFLVIKANLYTCQALSFAHLQAWLHPLKCLYFQSANTNRLIPR